MHCPNCGGSDVRESHSRGLQTGVLGMFGFVAYRCRACRNRFHRRPPESEGEEEIEQEASPAPEHEPDVDVGR